MNLLTMPYASVMTACQCSKCVHSTSLSWAPTVCHKHKLTGQKADLILVINQKVNTRLWKLLSEITGEKRGSDDLNHMIRIMGQGKKSEWRVRWQHEQQSRAGCSIETGSVVIIFITTQNVSIQRRQDFCLFSSVSKNYFLQYTKRVSVM